MPYTPLIRFDKDTEERLLAYLQTEIDNHETERSEHIEKIRRYENLYWADPRKAPTTATPLQQGAQIIIPVIAIAVEMLQAKMIQKLFGLDQFCSLSLPDQWDDIDATLEKIVDHELLVTARIKDSTEQAALDFLKYGTGVLKNGYVEINKFGINHNGEEEEEVEAVYQKGLCIDSVQLVNFLMPFASTDPNTSPWCGEYHTFDPYQLKLHCENKLFYPEAFKELEKFFYDLATIGQAKSLEFLRHKEKQEDKTPIWPKRVHLYEIWLSFNVDKDPEGKHKEIVVYYHRDSNYIVGARYNDRHDLSRPYAIAANFPVEGRWAGIGQCQMGEQFQIEITTQHRQRIDAAALAILRMFKAKKGSSISADEPVFAGKIWMVDEMDELEIFQSGEVYPSAYQNEQSAIMFWQQRSTVNELTLGMPQVGTPGTAAAEMARVAEGNMRFDYTYGRFKEIVRRVCLDSLCIIGKYGLRHEILYEQYSNGERVKEFLQQPPDLIKNEIILRFSLAGQSQNKLLDRATWTQLGGMLTSYYTNMLQIASQLGDQRLVQVIAKKAIVGGTEVMRQVFQSFDVRNIDKIILSGRDLTDGVEPNPATAIPGVAGLIQQPGAGFVNPIATTVGGGGV